MWSTICTVTTSPSWNILVVASLILITIQSAYSRLLTVGVTTVVVPDVLVPPDVVELLVPLVVPELVVPDVVEEPVVPPDVVEPLVVVPDVSVVVL